MSASWTTVDETTGERTRMKVVARKRRGRKPKVRTIHQQMIKGIPRPGPQWSVRLMLAGQATAVHASKPAGETMPARIKRHARLLEKRGHPMAAEITPPTGQAARWYEHTILCVPRTGRDVARQVARLCGDDSQVTIPIRSLADAVGHRDSAGRDSAYTRRGIKCLVDAEWLRAEVTGSGQDKVTTFYLLPGDESVEWFPVDDTEWLEARL
jgi:hypothetical protein